MQIVIVGYGSWGDVLPSLSLGLGLKEAGHDVRLLVTRDFVPWVKDRGLEIGPLEADHQATRRCFSSPQRLAVVRELRRSIAPALQAITRAMASGVGRPDVLVVNSSLLVAASGIAEACGARLIRMALQPQVPTSAVPIATFPAFPAWAPGSRLYNRLTYRAAHAVRWWSYLREQNELRRQQFGLPPLSLADFEALCRRTPSITLISPHLIPVPTDWTAHHRLTGFVFYDDDDWQPPAHLAEFLASGPPPVYIGFGSMHDEHPEESTRLILEALGRSGKRAVVHRGWAELGVRDLPDNVCLADYVPHRWLFPHMEAIVHHAGAGTSAAALRAGIPSVPVPHFDEQRFWARHLHASGAATRPLARSELTADNLAERLSTACRSDEIRARAKELGNAIRSERGLERSVAAIEDLARMAI